MPQAVLAGDPDLWWLTFGSAYWLPPMLGMDEDQVPWLIGTQWPGPRAT